MTQIDGIAFQFDDYCEFEGIVKEETISALVNFLTSWLCLQANSQGKNKSCVPVRLVWIKVSSHTFSNTS